MRRSLLLSHDWRWLCLAGTLTAMLSALPGCSVACPAILYGSKLTVSLDDSWPDRSELTLDVECIGENATACDLVGDVDGPVWNGTLTYATQVMRATVTRGAEPVAAVTFEPDFVAVEYPHGRQCPALQSAEASIHPPE